MIEMSEALRWLNQFDRSHLDGTNQRLFAEARNQRMNNAAIPDLVRTALQQARTSSNNGLEYSEALLNCALIEFDRGLIESARDHLTAAKKNYIRANDFHGAAVAAWMLGITGLALQDAASTYENWKWSLGAFKGLRTASKHVQTTRRWYTTIVISMKKDLVTLPQEAFTWINLFSSSHLIPFNRNLVELIDQNIQNGNRDDADRIINVLKDRTLTSTDLLECAEIFAETGLARFRMRESPLAIGDMKTAVKRYPAESHQQECVRWMLGAVQFWSDSQEAEAIRNWNTSLEGFKKLAQKADQNNQGTQRRWYRDRIVIMSGALQGKIAAGSTKFGSRDNCADSVDVTPSAEPYGPASKHSGNYQDRYQYLCGLVGGEKAVADGLIEYERKRAPRASLGELIERAIERLLRDRS